MKHITCVAIIMSSFIVNTAMATTYYVKPNGDDAANGKSHATAWKSIGQVNSFSAQTGDDVYFLAGGSWNKKQLSINWNGTDSNRAIIGSYYMNNGNETIGVPSGTNKPTIIGSYTGPCSGAAGSCINTSGAVPSGGYAGLIQVNANYVTIQNLRAQNSAGRGIVLNTNYHHAIFEGNEVYYTAGNSIIFNRGTSYNIMRNNDTSLCAIGWKQGDWIAVSKTWPTCNSAVESHHNIFEGNYVHESYGEGIVMLIGSSYNIVRGNKIVGVRSTNIYMDNGSNNIIENNILIGDRDGEYTYNNAPDGHKYGGGIDVKVESYSKMYDSVNNIVRNNLLFRTGGLLMGLEPEAELEGRKLGVKFLNNTLIETASYIKLNDDSQFYDSVEIANNIFYGSLIAENGCKITPTQNVNVHHNHWGDLQNDADCIGNSGDTTGNPKLSRTNWDSVSITNIPSADDFKPKSDSPVINSAKAQTNSVFSLEFNHANELTGNCNIDLTEASKDFFCNNRDATPDMGAIDQNSISITSVVTIDAPVGLTLTFSSN